MYKTIVNEFLSLDGVAQAPGGGDEDTADGFAHGGWHMRYMGDDGAQRRVLRGIIDADAFLLGRRTYDIFAAYWPNAGKEERVIAEPLNAKPKHVVSRSLSEPLAWNNSHLVKGELDQALGTLKRDGDGELHVIGSTQLVRTLLALGLVDELRLMIDPVIVGGGKRIFEDDGRLRPLRLVDSYIAGTGAIFATYVPEG